MSDATLAHGAHGGPDHVPHVLPLSTYIKTWLALMVLTGLTVGASYIHLGTQGNLILALLIATVKAVTVAAIFMHLKYDHKFLVVIIMMSVLFVSLMISFSMFDTETRGRADGAEAYRPKNIKKPFDEAVLQNKNAAPAGILRTKADTVAAPPATAAPSAEPAATAAPSAEPAATAAPSAEPAATAAPSAEPAATAAPSAEPAATAAPSAAPAATATP